MSPRKTLRELLADNPRVIGALFTITMLLSTAQGVLASNSTGISGP